MRLKDKIAIITGAAQGIGRAYALRFAREGAHVVVGDLREEAARAVADECSALGPEAVALRLDVADEASTQDVVARTMERFGRIDVLINNAAIYYDLDREDRPSATSTRPVGEPDRRLAMEARGRATHEAAAQGEDHPPVVHGGLPRQRRHGGHRESRHADAALPLQRGQNRHRRAHQVHGGRARPVGHQRQRHRAGRHDDRGDEEDRAGRHPPCSSCSARCASHSSPTT